MANGTAIYMIDDNCEEAVEQQAREEEGDKEREEEWSEMEIESEGEEEEEEVWEGKRVHFSRLVEVREMTPEAEYEAGEAGAMEGIGPDGEEGDEGEIVKDDLEEGEIRQ